MKDDDNAKAERPSPGAAAGSSADGLEEPGGENFAQMLDGYLKRAPVVSAGEEIKGRIVSIGPEYVVLDLGTRSEGLLAREEVTHDGELTVAPGETLGVIVSSVSGGTIMCALRMGAATGREHSGDREATLASLLEARERGLPVEGTVKEAIKGGFSVQVMGLRGFCPISQIDSAFCEHPEEHVGRAYAFLVRQVDERGRNIVLSRRELLEREAEKLARDLWQQLEIGAVYDGVVKSVQKYGAFVDIGGVEGLIHVSEMAYERVADPASMFTAGQQVRVAIKDIDRERGRIGLSVKALQEDPWLEVPGQLPVGSVHSGKVVRIAPFGAFVELLRGVDGLLHISELGEGRRINNPREVVKEGDEVTVRIKEVEPDRRRIALAMADAAEEDDAAEVPVPAVDQQRPAPAQSGRESGFGTLGDLFGDVLKKER